MTQELVLTDDMTIDDLPVPEGYNIHPLIGQLIVKTFADNNLGLVAKIRKSLKISAPGGGGLAFKIPDAEGGKPKMAETLRFVVLWATPDYALYEGDYGKEGAKAPICKSTNGRTAELPFPQNRFGYGSPENSTGTCETCPKGRPISLNEKRKIECRWGKQVYVVIPGTTIPYMISVSPTSMNNFDSWLSTLAAQGRNTLGVEVEMEVKLERQQGSTNEYAQMVFRTLRVLTPDERASIKGLSAAYLPVIMRDVQTPMKTREPDELAAIKQQLLTTGGKPVAPQAVGEVKVADNDDDEPVL